MDGTADFVIPGYTGQADLLGPEKSGSHFEV